MSKTITENELFKVVWTDGYNRETVAERTVASHLDALDAEIICERLRAESNWEGNWWVVKPQLAPLWQGLAEFCVDSDDWKDVL